MKQQLEYIAMEDDYISLRKRFEMGERKFRVFYQCNDNSGGLPTIDIVADYFTVSVIGDKQLLYLWEDGREEAVASFSDGIWLFAIDVTDETTA